MTIKIGVLATLDGPFSILGEDSVRGAEMAVAEFGGAVADQEITLSVEATLIDPDNAESAALRLLEDKKVDILVGPLSGNEGLRIKQVAKRYPHKTFLNGTSGAQELTFVDPAPNFFNFATTGAQLLKGLGTYAYQELGYRNIAVISEDYSYPYAQYGAFKLEFCGAGGRIAQETWVPVMTRKYQEVIANIPAHVDAVFALLGGDDAIMFTEQYHEAGVKFPLLGGAIQADQSVLSYPNADASSLVGTITAGATADDLSHPLWQQFVNTYRTTYPDAFGYPSYFALTYYLNTKAALLGLTQVSANLSDRQRQLQRIIAGLRFDGPAGPVALDKNRGVITSTYLSRIEKDSAGRLYRKLLREIPDVNQTLGMDEEDYRRIGVFSKTNPPCR